MRRVFLAAALAVSLVALACSGSGKTAPSPTFTPAPVATGGAARPAPSPAHPLVAQSCLRSLSSYRFAGSFGLKSPTPAATAQSGPPIGPAGSLANLLSNVSFQGSALAPDRYQAQVTFGGGGVQPLDVLRIGEKTYSRFGNGQWQEGDQIRGLGGVGAFDPQTLCELVLVPVDAGSQQPAHEIINGVPSLRYEVEGPQVARAFRRFGSAGGPAATATATGTPSVARLTVWAAEHGGYPVRFAVSSDAGASNVALQVDITDVNGRDIRIDPPA